MRVATTSVRDSLWRDNCPAPDLGKRKINSNMVTAPAASPEAHLRGGAKRFTRETSRHEKYAMQRGEARLEGARQYCASL
jgi:hypothetical protein